MPLKLTTAKRLESRSSIIDSPSSILHPQSSIFHPAAFTLIELMISIALVLLLILGVNQVFTYTTQAVGAGEAINSAIRSSRAAQTTFASDFNGIVPNGLGPNDAASIIISSRAYYAFRSAKDQAAEGTPLSTTYPPAAYLDLAGTGKFGDPNVNGDTVYPGTYNFRNHRLDVLSFFSRGQFNRQTGNLGTFVDNLSSSEAWVWYGHLMLPNNITPSLNKPLPDSDYYFPSFGTSAAVNPNNYYGSQFTLGRVATLLVERNPDNAFGTIKDSSGMSQQYITRFPYASDTPPSDIQPLACTSNAILGADGTPYYLQNSRLDLASTSILNFRNKLQAFINNFQNLPGTAYWYDQMLDGNPNPYIAPPGGLSRFECNPFVTKPMTAVSMAQASPYFIGGCSQFIVEFAGDFFTQDSNPDHAQPSAGVTLSTSSYGDILSYGSDGQLDFTVVSDSSGAQTRQIKWYGMPRNTSGLAGIIGTNGDVLPVHNWLQMKYLPTGTPPMSVPPLPFEGPLKSNGQLSIAYRTNYGNTGKTPVTLTQTEANAGYTCAFGPNDPAPKLIRITMTLEDPTGRLPDGVTYQYVFPVPTPGN